MPLDVAMDMVVHGFNGRMREGLAKIAAPDGPQHDGV